MPANKFFNATRLSESFAFAQQLLRKDEFVTNVLNNFHRLETKE
jgi:hypothetical protein